jgi:hypothetical protein
MGEVAATAADFPDSIVGPLPGLLKVVDECLDDGPTFRVFCESVAPREINGRSRLAVYVELELSRGCIADTNGFGSFVPRQPIELVLGEASPTAEVVHDLELVRCARRGAQNPVAKSSRLIDVAGQDESI